MNTYKIEASEIYDPPALTKFAVEARAAIAMGAKVIDFTEVRFAGSMFIGEFAALVNEARQLGVRLTCLNVNSVIRMLFERVGLNRLVDYKIELQEVPQ